MRRRRQFRGVFRGKAPGLIRFGGIPSSGSGGGGNEPEPEPVVPGSPIKVDPHEYRTHIDIHNDGDTPTAVELSFANGKLEGVDPDHGTSQSPSYVVDPGVQGVRSSRRITLMRLGVASGNTDPETVVLTSSSGTSSSFDYSVEGPYGTVSEYLNFLVPSSGMRFMMDHPATGPLTASGVLTTEANYSLNPNGRTSVYDTTFPGLTGYTENIDSNKNIVQVNFPNTTAGKASITQNLMPGNFGRSYLWIYSQLVAGGHPNFGGQPLFQPIGGVSPIFHIEASPYSGRTYFAYSRLNTGNTYAHMYYKGNPTLPSSSTVTDHGHTVLGPGYPEHLNPGSSPAYTSEVLTVIACCYDNTTNDMTYRWKQTGHQSTGHSLMKMNNLYYTPQGNYGALVTTRHYYQPINYGNPIRHRLHSVFDKNLSASEFENICRIVGLSV